MGRDVYKGQLLVCDLDETLLSSQEWYLHPDVPKTFSRRSPYQEHNVVVCYTLHKYRMRAVFQAFVKGGGEVAVITAGGMSKASFENFFELEYRVKLPREFKFVNKCKKKGAPIARWVGSGQYKKVMFVDNCQDHLDQAKAAVPNNFEGLVTIYADTNKNDLSAGKAYICLLEQHLSLDQVADRDQQIQSLRDSLLAIFYYRLARYSNLDQKKPTEMKKFIESAEDVIDKYLLSGNYDQKYMQAAINVLWPVVANQKLKIPSVVASMLLASTVAGGLFMAVQYKVSDGERCGFWSRHTQSSGLLDHFVAQKKEFQRQLCAAS